VFSTLRRLTHPRPPVPKVPVFITVPPDNSWGVVMAGFYCLLVAQGVAQSHGKLLMALSHDLDISIVQAASFGSIQAACSYFFGPVASAMVNRYGLRRAGCVGAITSTFGLLLAFAFANDLPGVLLGYGILTGIGFGISYSVVVVTIGLHFEKYRSLAIAVAMSGVGFGPVFFSPMVVYMLKTDIDLKFVFLTYAALSAVTIFVALVFRDLDPFTVFVGGSLSVGEPITPSSN
jgi:MFS transporter, MCT family, solute carrier family 16 (monocarboxylic acid transporters), member 14